MSPGRIRIWNLAQLSATMAGRCRSERIQAERIWEIPDYANRDHSRPNGSPNRKGGNHRRLASLARRTSIAPTAFINPGSRIIRTEARPA